MKTRHSRVINHILSGKFLEHTNIQSAKIIHIYHCAMSVYFFAVFESLSDYHLHAEMTILHKAFPFHNVVYRSSIQLSQNKEYM
jgi:hypothetical protein